MNPGGEGGVCEAREGERLSSFFSRFYFFFLAQIQVSSPVVGGYIRHYAFPSFSHLTLPLLDPPHTIKPQPK